MAAVAHSKKDLFRKQQIEWIKIGAIWGIVLPGLAYIDFMYRNPIFYTIYILFCYFAFKITLKIRGHLAKLSADYTFLQQLEALDKETQVLSQVKVETGKKEAKIDWILVNHQGAWCVEVNILSGKICGKEKEKDWSQILKLKNPKSKPLAFPNPLLEVQYGTKRLKEFLKQSLKENIPVYQAVVFTKASELEVPSTSEAVLLSQFGQVFKEKESNVITSETVQKIVDSLK